MYRFHDSCTFVSILERQKIETCVPREVCSWAGVTADDWSATCRYM